MKQKTTLVVTSIARDDNKVLHALSEGAKAHDIDFIVIGDVSSPREFHIDGCRFLGLDEQAELPFAFAKQCPTRHYARKNIGYLLAFSEGAEVIIETDDDNYPREGFWAEREREATAPLVSGAGWLNVCKYFTSAHIWPRGLPLDMVLREPPALSSLPRASADCPVQQGLADENPDVDAIYRLLLPLPQNFAQDVQVILGQGSWSPYNSQNTSWWREAAPLMYLPSYCSFRVTDIWRALVAQRICWESGWSTLFHGPTVWQERNEHDLMRDFRDEVPGYLNNAAIKEALEALSLKKDKAAMAENMRQCYEALVGMGVVGKEELPLLDAWLADVAALTR